MKILEYKVTFLTPAFLGNAEQNGQWRTPPFKALLRQWWRVAYSADKNFNVDLETMRKEEGLLFGHAWLENDRDQKGVKVAARKSLIRIRLEDPQNSSRAWALGTQQGVYPLSEGLDTSYAWFGLIKRGKGMPNRNGLRAEQVESVRQLHIAFPDQYEERMRSVISLIHAFGLLGSRNRGGWGALDVKGTTHPVKEFLWSELLAYSRPLADCFQHDWAMSLARDENGLCLWESKNQFDSWDKAMKFIAIQRKQVRTNLKQKKDLRPALGFASPGRMPSPLRWKVIATQQGNLQVRVFALPHRIPDDANKHLLPQDLQLAWEIVTSTLDRSNQFRNRAQ